MDNVQKHIIYIKYTRGLSFMCDMDINYNMCETVILNLKECGIASLFRRGQVIRYRRK
jgi:hypothetical protein